jgi:hypothetical protein
MDSIEFDRWWADLEPHLTPERRDSVSRSIADRAWHAALERTLPVTYTLRPGEVVEFHD